MGNTFGIGLALLDVSRFGCLWGIYKQPHTMKRLDTATCTNLSLTPKCAAENSAAKE